MYLSDLCLYLESEKGKSRGIMGDKDHYKPNRWKVPAKGKRRKDNINIIKIIKAILRKN